MSKPDWKDAPEWANWLAMDRDGMWYWYEVEPKIRGSSFASAGLVEFANFRDTDWEQSKEAKP
jgi:hypothetical protein